MNAVYSFLLVRFFVLSLVLGFPLQISTPQQITTTNYEKQNIGECKFVEEVGFIIEPDAAGRDNIPVVQELQHLSPTKGYTQSISAPIWCQYSQLLYWWCSIGRDDFPSSFPNIFVPVQSVHNLNKSECFFLSGVCSWC